MKQKIHESCLEWWALFTSATASLGASFHFKPTESLSSLVLDIHAAVGIPGLMHAHQADTVPAC